MSHPPPDLIGNLTPTKPRTEPSTPLRPGLHKSTQSAPPSSRSRLSSIHLPKENFLQVIEWSASSTRQSSHKYSTYASTTPSRSPTTPSSRLTSSEKNALVPYDLHNRSDYGSQFSTPRTRRLSDHLRIRRRRRSSAGTFYEAGYEGAVTKDFLRQFSRALVEERRKTTPHSYEDEDNVRVYQALDQEHRLHSISPQEPTQQSDFDYSLPLPSDDVMKSPAVLNLKREKSPSPPATPRLHPSNEPQKPTFKSYLERILESRKNKSIFEKEPDADLPDEADDMHAVITTSKFVIENTIHGLPEYSVGEDPSKLPDMKLAEPLDFDDVSTYDEPSSQESSDGHVEPPKAFSKRLSGFLHRELDNTHTPENYYVDEMPPWKSYSPNRPYLGLDDHDHEKSETDPNEKGLEESFFDLNHDFLTVDDENIEENEIIGSNNNSDVNFSEKVQGKMTEDENHNEAEQPQSNVLPQKRRRNSSTTSELPQGLVKGLVNLAQRMPDGQNAPKPRTKKRRLSLDLLHSISKKSNEFLQQLMSDLDAYAGHRDSNTINIQDAILYLSRMDGFLGSGIELDRISKLAQNVFPLEILVKLDNSLQMSSVAKLQRNPLAKTSNIKAKEAASTGADENALKLESGDEDDDLTDEEKEKRFVQAH